MIRLHRLDHVCLRVADLDEASARWQLQFALVERSREGGRALLACNDEPYCLELVEGDAPGHDHSAFELAQRVLARRRPGALRRPRCRVGRARGLAVPGRPRRPSRAGDALPRPGERGRPPAAARAALDDRSPRRRQEARPRQQPHGRHPGGRPVLRRRSRDARLRLARRGRGLVPRQLRPPRDGARRPRLRALPPPRLRHGRHREDARHARPRRPPRALARLGAGPPRDRGEHRELRAHRRGGVLRRALLRHGAAPGRPRAARLPGRPLLVEHVGAAAAALVLPLRPGRDRVRAGEPRDARPRPAAAEAVS